MQKKIWTAEEVERLLALSQNTLSLNETINTGDDDGDKERGDFIEYDGPSPEDVVIDNETRDRLLNAIENYLTPRENVVMKMRYGFIDGRPKTLEEVGKRFNVTRERIRQIEVKALRKLRHKLSMGDFNE